MIAKVDITNFFRSLSFGGLLGCGAAFLLFLSYPHLFADRVSLEVVVAFGSLLGASLHRAIDACVIKTFFLPFGRFVKYYGKLVELTLNHHIRLMDDDTFKQFKYELDREYFLGIAPSATIEKKILPP